MQPIGLQGLWGHPQAVIRLKEALSRPVHAYLFAGPTGAGKLTGARAFAQGLLCENPASQLEFTGLDACGVCRTCQATQNGNHPDLRVWTVGEGEKKFKVEQIRELILAVGRKPFSAKRQVHILADLDTLTLAGANALLKTLEEPPPTSTLILLTRDPEQVLPTLLSRCQIVRFGLVSSEKIATVLVSQMEVEPEVARRVALHANGRIGEALSLLVHGGGSPKKNEENWPQANAIWTWAETQAAKSQEGQMACLDSLLRHIREVAVSRPFAKDETLPVPASNAWHTNALAIEEAREALQRHANAKLVFDRLGHLLAFAPRV